jgi:hypothetical protein
MNPPGSWTSAANALPQALYSLHLPSYPRPRSRQHPRKWLKVITNSPHFVALALRLQLLAPNAYRAVGHRYCLPTSGNLSCSDQLRHDEARDVGEEGSGEDSGLE